MKIALFILIGVIIGYVIKDLLTKESEITYIIKKLRAKKGGSIDVEGTVKVDKSPREIKKELKQTRRVNRLKNK